MLFCGVLIVFLLTACFWVMLLVVPLAFADCCGFICLMRVFVLGVRCVVDLLYLFGILFGFVLVVGMLVVLGLVLCLAPLFLLCTLTLDLFAIVTGI